MSGLCLVQSFAWIRVLLTCQLMKLSASLLTLLFQLSHIRDTFDTDPAPESLKFQRSRMRKG
jgi:hypothetical protein